LTYIKEPPQNGVVFFLYICYMASVNRVYRILKDLTNKEQKGFITPTVFNNFAYTAQMNIYNEMFTEMVKAKQLKRQGFNPSRDKSLTKQVREDLSYFTREVTVVVDGGFVAKPSNMSKLISIRKTATADIAGIADRDSFELVYDTIKLDDIIGSNLSSPTNDFPVALISRDIEVFPSTLNSVDITYYCYPGSIDVNNEFSDLPPVYSTVLAANEFSFDLFNSRDFMLPDHYEPELVAEIAKLIGVRLRDQVVQGYAAQEEAKQ